MRIAVANPSYLGAAIIGPTLRSVACQTYREWTCVVVNDGAEDGTRDVVASSADERFRYVSDGRHRGQFAISTVRSWRRWRAIRASSGCSAPMTSCSQHDLEDIVRVFGANPSVGLVATDYGVIDQSGELLFRVDMRGRDDLVMSGREYLLKGSQSVTRSAVRAPLPCDGRRLTRRDCSTLA